MGSTNLKVNEPSMEDILASIRRIISEEPEAGFHEPEPSPLRTVLDIAERHISSSFYPEASAVTPDEPRAALEGRFQEDSLAVDLRENHDTSQPVRSPAPAKPQPVQAFAQPCERNPGEALMSRVTEASVSESFDRLSAVSAASRSQTVDELMREMLRPMLKAWLDDHLPALVERLVQAEITRVTRG